MGPSLHLSVLLLPLSWPMTLSQRVETWIPPDGKKCTSQDIMVLMRTRSWTTFSRDTLERVLLHLDTRPVRSSSHTKFQHTSMPTSTHHGLTSTRTTRAGSDTRDSHFPETLDGSIEQVRRCPRINH